MFRVNIKKSYIFGPLGVSENIILEKVENIPATIHIYTILLNHHLTLAYRDAMYLFHIFEIDKCHWCSASNCKVLLLHLLLKIMYYTDDGINQTESTVGVFCQVPKASLRYDSPKLQIFELF